MGDTHNLEVDASHQKSRVRNPLPAPFSFFGFVVVSFNNCRGRGCVVHQMSPADFFSFAGTVTFAILVAAVIALFIYEHYAAKKK